MIDATNDSEASRAERVVALGRLTMRSEREGDIHTLRLAGELDLASAEQVEPELERVEAGDAAMIVIDLSALTFIDSTGVRLLVSAEARSRGDSGRLTLVRGSDRVQRVFALCGVQDRLPFAG